MKVDGPGKYIRTEEIRQRCSEAAKRAPHPKCAPDCICKRHTNKSGGAPKCYPGCMCLRHNRTKEHNEKIAGRI